MFDVVTKYIDGICGGCGNHRVPRQLPVIKNFGGLAYQARLLLTFGRMRDRETIDAELRLLAAVRRCVGAGTAARVKPPCSSFLPVVGTKVITGRVAVSLLRHPPRRSAAPVPLRHPYR